MKSIESILFVTLVLLLATFWGIMQESNHVEWSPKVNDYVNSGIFVNYKGFAIFCKKSTNAGLAKPTLLLIHGFPTSSYDWLEMWPLLEDKFNVIAVDLLGMGFSAKPARSYSILEQADIVEHVFQVLGLTRSVHILSHDYGDTVAQELLWRSDHHKTESSLNVISLCLLNGGVIHYMHRPIMLQRLLLHPISGPIVSLLSNKYLFKRNFVKVFTEKTKPSDEVLDDIWAIIKHNNGHRINHLLIHYITDRQVHGERWIQAINSTNVPVRLINGPADPVSGIHLVNEYRRIIHDADVVVLDEDIAHYPQMECSTSVAHHYIQFVSNHLNV